MLQTAKTFVTKLVRYIEWIVDPLRGHQFYLIWYCYGQKRPFFLAKTTVFGHERLQTPQMAGKSGSNGGSQLNTCRRTNLGAKLVRITHPVVWKWLQSGPFGAKIAVFGHKRLHTPQMAGKSGSNGGSQLNTCRRTNLGAKLVRKTHPVVWKWPQSGQFGAKNDIFGHRRLQTPQMVG